MVYNRESPELEEPNYLFTTSEAQSIVLHLKNADLEKKLADMQAAVKQITDQRDVLIKEVQNEKFANEFYTKKLTNIMDMCKSGIQMMYDLSSVTADVLNAAKSGRENGESSKRVSRSKTYAVRPMISGHVISKPTIRLNRVTDLQAHTASRFPRKRQALGAPHIESPTTDESSRQDYLLDMEIQQFSQSDENDYSSSSSSSASYSGNSLQNVSSMQEAQAAFERNSRNLSVRIDHLRSNILKNFKLDTSLYRNMPPEEVASTSTPKESEDVEQLAATSTVQSIPSKPTTPKRNVVKRRATGAVEIRSPKVMLRRLPTSAKAARKPEKQANLSKKIPAKANIKGKIAAKTVASKVKRQPKTSIVKKAAKNMPVKKTQKATASTRKTRNVKLLVL